MAVTRVLVLLGIFSISACAGVSSRPVAANHADDVRAIRGARLAQNAAIVAADPEAVARFWTDDVEIRRGFGGFVLGKPAYKQLFIDDPKNLFVRMPVSIQVSDAWPLAFESGEWSWHEGSANAPAIVTGRYSAQWVKREGRWLIRGEVFTALRCAGVGCTKAAVP